MAISTNWIKRQLQIILNENYDINWKNKMIQDIIDDIEKEEKEDISCINNDDYSYGDSQRHYIP